MIIRNNLEVIESSSKNLLLDSHTGLFHFTWVSCIVIPILEVILFD